MKKLFVFLGLCLLTLTTWAQSQYVSCERTAEQDLIDDAGRSGILVLSKRSDLVVTVLNSPNAKSVLRVVIEIIIIFMRLLSILMNANFLR